MLGLLIVLAIQQVKPVDRAIDRGIAYLSVEVPRWRIGHECRSCHHQGDGARALFVAKGAGLRVDDQAIADVKIWLMDSQAWEKNGADGPFNDKRVARLQFSSALASGVVAKSVVANEAMRTVADQLVKDQADDGSWPVAEVNVLGTPVTRGKPLATALAIKTLMAADTLRYSASIERAKLWVIANKITSTLDAAVAIRVQVNNPRALAFLIEGQSEEGGWGPYVTSAPEVFDTAGVLWALERTPHTHEIKRMVAKSREYLIRSQLEDGSWPETTRPSGSESLAQRVSTTAWALIALITTRTID